MNKDAAVEKLMLSDADEDAADSENCLLSDKAEHAVFAVLGGAPSAVWP